MTEAVDYQNYMRLLILMNQAALPLRVIFKERWKNLTGQQWIDVEKFGRMFVNTIGKKFYKKSRPKQKKELERGNTRFWNITLLTKILLKVTFGDSNIPADEQNLIAKLTMIRNEIFHLEMTNTFRKKFHSLWTKLSNILLKFGCSENTLEEIRSAAKVGGISINNSNIPNPAHNKQAKCLRKYGNKAFKQGRFNKALEMYTKAIVLPDVSDKDLAVLYVTRAAVYLKKDEKEKWICFSNAIENAKKDCINAVNLNPTLWEAHFQLGCVYQKADQFEKGIRSFNHALGLDPTNRTVRSERDACRQILGKNRRHDNADQTTIPRNSKRQCEDAKNISTKNPPKLCDELKQSGKHLADAFETTHCKDGFLDSTLNYPNAKFHPKSGSHESAEAIFNRAVSFRDGTGPRRNVKIAIALLKKAASQPATVNGLPNVGVAEAENELAIMHMDGVGFDSNPHEALSWYKRASDHGLGKAANNLGLMFINGIGVERNVQLAIEYWELAAKRNDILAIESLAYHYLKEGKPTQAVVWFKRALDNGSTRAQTDKESFEFVVKKLEKVNEASFLVKWEKVNRFNSDDNLCLEERILKFLNAIDPTAAKILQLFSYHQNYKNSRCFPSASGKQFQYNPDTVKEFVDKGSKTAYQIQKAVFHFREGIRLLPYCNQKVDAVHNFAECFRSEYRVAQWTENSREELLEIVENMLETTPNSQASDLDRDVRICYAYLRMNSSEETIPFLHAALKKYPDEIYFYHHYVNLYGCLSKYEDGLRLVNQALTKFPDAYWLHHAKAEMMASIEYENPTDVINAYLQFVRIAPKDHHNIPDSYYGIASTYLRVSMMSEDDSVTFSSLKIYPYVEMAEKQYQLGLAAENFQLSCFLPYDSIIKPLVKGALDVIAIETSNVHSERMKSTKETKPKHEAKFAKSPLDNVSNKDMTNTLAPLRLQMIARHRSTIWEQNNAAIDGKDCVQWTHSPDKEHFVPLTLVGLKSITLQDMNGTKDKIFSGFVLEVTSIEDAIIGMTMISLVIEDENKDIQRCYVYNLKAHDRIQDKLGFGCKLSIINPHVTVTMDGQTCIRVDNDVYPVVFSGREIERCRFCGKGLLSILALYLVVGFGAELICNSIGFVYPAYASMHALESSNKDDDTKWLTYWVVFASFSVVEFFSDIFLDWFPFYWLAKCVFLIWCFAPIGNNGSQVLYNRIIRPFFLKNKERIDNVLSKGMEKVASYASSAVGEAAKHVAEESMKKD